MEKKYDHLAAEQQARSFWEQQKTYIAENNPGPLYSIDTPPPTVSGALHIGHIFSYTQTDIIARYKRMQGFSVFYPFGFDDNGLPTERFVEKKRNVTAHSLGRSAFIALCLEETKGVEEEFKQLWQRMGLSVDWQACYSTISAETRKISQLSFIELYKKGFVYRKDEPALFCTTCRTSVAQAELDDIEKPSTFNDIAFEVHPSIHSSGALGTNGAGAQPLIISTTRPELLPACVALLYNPQDTRYQHLKGLTAKVPLFGFEVPILADEQVRIDKGTGLVMCCTFGDKTDIEWFKKFNLPYKPAFGPDGKFLSHTGQLAGLKVAEARKKIIELLQQEGHLLKQQPITHAVNIHERCKQDIEYLMLPQWFLQLLPHKQAFVELADTINWYPSFMKARYKNWVENISWDWCLSRQRYFGISFPAWHCTACKEILLAREDQLPIDPQETPYHGTCPHCGATEIIADTDVMDTWNTSSLTPYICAQLYDSKDFLPMSMRPQAHDIIRTWAFYTIVKTWMHDKTVPWRDIIISGHVLSNEKQKISKSQENSPLAPENLLKAYSADAIRYWTASASLGHDVAFSDNQLKIGQRLITKLWNAFLFVGEHTTQTAGIETPAKYQSKVNRWIIHRASITYEKYHASCNEHEFGLALDAVEKFFWHDFCDNYLELIKDQLFNPHNYDAIVVAETRATLYHVGIRILQLYAPFMPYVTETIYQALYKQNIGDTSLHQTRFGMVQKQITEYDAAQCIDHVLAIVAQVRKLKSDQQLSLKTEIAQLAIHASQGILTAIGNEEQLLKGVTRAIAITYNSEPGATAIRQQNNAWYATVAL